VSAMLRRIADHRFTKGHASAYLEGELSAPQRERVERHTSVCPQCRALLESLRRMLDTLHGLAAPPRRSVTEGALVRLRRDG
jgi:anti-sigma factor RsiW